MNILYEISSYILLERKLFVLVRITDSPIQTGI